MGANLQKIIKDSRYSIDLEYCCCSQKMYVSRFCGNFIKADKTKNDAILTCIFHQDERTLKIL